MSVLFDRLTRTGSSFVLGCTVFWSSLAHAAPGAVDFNKDIRPLLSENCLKCHGPDETARKAGFRLDVREEVVRNAESGRPAIVPRDPEKSELLRRVRASDAKMRMPPEKAGKALTPAQVDLLERWISEGADYAVHWAYEKPVRPAIPAVLRTEWPRNDFDRFVLARLESEKISPSADADLGTLVRRASLDLVGLPPTVEEADKVIDSRVPDAFERYVDELLGSPRFGEHWARLWLDLARYADSAGYADDPGRTIWPYRDYVIRSLNRNKPFDRFTIEQFAGDLLEDADEETKTGTAFHRNTMTNNEGGTDDEEFRNAAVVDRVNTSFAVWMGTSMACAQCHTHRYDPLTQQEYFKVFAIFNNTEDADRTDESPVLELPSEDEKRRRAELQGALAALKTATDTNRADTGAIAKLQKDLAGIKPATVPIMRELPAGKQRETRIHVRGNFKVPGDQVSPGIPAVLRQITPHEPTNRLQFAQWLVSRDNPLTARVLANRLHEQIFGTGIVRTTEEFGSQGEPPSNPELLDWLATEIVRNGWDLKKHLRMLVTSSTYRQSSRTTSEGLERDPENLLLARGPRFRATGELLRDQALFAAGLLSEKMYGPPVRPPQPSLGLTAAFGSTLDWKTSEGEDRYRRSIYTEWRRTNPYASLVTFDAPNREICTLRRPRSNTPLQALAILNDPVILEASQALGKRAAARTGSPSEKLSVIFRACLTRSPSAEEEKRLLEFYEAARDAYSSDRAQAAALMKRLPGSVVDLESEPNKPELAAWTVTANALLNLDEMFMRP